ncbi:HupE/UreJ family protein [Nocardioides acrostichi]|uniref:HupE/UreJ family protein n=1 Tax=Nocardioides acrostichi TaxID=2784339 RepID=A0A930V4K6_9ACTN|nr:HupE/UreJ family protein [Nocardioides acrostichi]MBF4163635.1 HupE/UreJ family protein [Nocardioides acrostichi]
MPTLGPALRPARVRHLLVRLAAALGVGAALLLCLGGLAPASAHPSPWTTVVVSPGSEAVTLDAQIPIEEYELATGESIAPTPNGVEAAAAGLARRVARDVGVVVAPQDVPAGSTGISTQGGVLLEPRVVEVSLGHVGGYPSLSVRLSVPTAGPAHRVALRWLLVSREVPSHKAYVSSLAGGSTTLVGLATQADPWVEVIGTGARGTAHPVGLRTMIGTGMRHIAGGYDHLLFLTMLLLPAPLVVRGRRGPGGDATAPGAPRRGVIATARLVAGIATAFTLGHSITLALVSFGLLDVPGKPVEIAVAVSIVVAAVHAVRPLVPRGELAIAAGFGLVHGCAFATTIVELGLDRAHTLLAVLGFNLGIELAQLCVVVATVPLLYLASASRDYAYLVLAVAGAGSVCALDWILALLRDTPPALAPVFDTLSDHPVWSWAGLAALCLSLHLTRSASEPAMPAGRADAGRAARKRTSPRIRADPGAGS